MSEQIVYIYEWMAWEGFFMPTLFNNSVRITGCIYQNENEIISKVIANTGYFVFHINLTKTHNFIENRANLINILKEKGFKLINEGVLDTSKNWLQKACIENKINSTSAKISGDPDELLIVKTNFNYAGRSENKLTSREKEILSLSTKNYSTDLNYTIASRKNLPKDTWKNEILVVEKFINNVDNLFYRAHKLFYRIVLTEVIDENLIRKMPDGIKTTNYYFDLKQDNNSDENYKNFENLILQIECICKYGEIDFGAFDIVKSDSSEYFIIDINLTPYWGFSPHPAMFNFLSEALSL